MPIAYEPVTTFQDLDDGPGALAAAHDGLVPQWSDTLQRFVMVRLPAASQVHVAGGGGGGLVQLRDMLDVQGQPGAASDGFAYLYNATVDKFILSEVDVAGETPASILAKLLTVDGAGSTLDADTLDGIDSTDFVLATNYEDADVLAKIKNVDGSGSGLDADTLDGNDSADFATAGHGHALVDLSDVDITPGAGVDGYSVVYDDGSGNFILSDVTGGGGYTNEQAQDAVGGILTDTGTIDFTYDDAGNAITADVKDGSITATKLADGAALAEILDDDGAGSLLDADLLDGQHAAAFAAASHTHPSTDVTDFTEAAQDAVGGMIADTATIDLTYTDATPELKADVKDGSITATKLADGAALAEILDDDGAGSGLDADLLDGNHASAFESAGASAAAIATHVGEADPHTQYLLESGYTAADVLAKLLTVDGPASTLDADTLDGNDSAAFATATHTHEVDQRADMFSDVEGDPANVGGAAADGTSTYAARRDHAHTIGAGVITSTMLQDGAALAEILDDDGAGSLLDADLLDGQHAAAFAAASHTHPSTDVTDFTEAAQDAVGGMIADTATIDLTYTDATPELKADVKDGSITATKLADGAALAEILDDDGAGSGLDADLLDGNHASAFESAGASATHAALTAAHGATGAVVGTTNSQTLTNKTLTTPVITDFTNAQHDHQDADDGGQLDHGAALIGLADDDHTQYLLATGARTGATSSPQVFALNPISGWFDTALADATNGSHFNDNDSSYPDGWTEADAGFSSAGAPAGTNYKYGFWRLNGDATDTSWKYRKQSGIDIEALSANAWQTFMVGPLIFRDGAYAADVDYYFGVYRNNSGIDETYFVRTHVWWDSANVLWKARGERKNGTTQVDGSWYTLPQTPLIQPLYVRMVFRNVSAGKTCRAYIGSNPFVASHLLLLDSAVGVVTLGNVWWQFHQTRSTGIQDYLLIGGIDASADP